MSILQPTGMSGTVKALLLNDDATDLTTAARRTLTLRFDGIEGDSHNGLTRKSCNRVKQQYPIDTVIRNTRQISIVSSEELAMIAQAMQLNSIRPEWVGANLVLQDIPSLSRLPPSSRLVFAGGASIVVDMENAPCRYPGEIIEQHYPGARHKFAKNAQGLRGVTAWVEREGDIAVNESVVLHVPAARPYPLS